MATPRQSIVEKLSKKYLSKMTIDCIELSPKLDDAFDIREEVINNLKRLITKK